jgi:hypothetical protein
LIAPDLVRKQVSNEIVPNQYLFIFDMAGLPAQSSVWFIFVSAPFDLAISATGTAGTLTFRALGQ